MKKTVFRFLITLLIALVKVSAVSGVEVQIPNPNNYPVPVPLSADEEARLGKLMPRTMHLLASSTPANKKKVRIAIYGQSLSDGNNIWWQTLRDALKVTYPNADIEVNCLGIGGCASGGLWYATISDIITYYPDLVIFHVYGHHTYYETIVRFIRGCTTAEMLVQTDHFGGNSGSGSGCDWDYDLTDMAQWDNKMSFQYVKGYCDTYGLERDDRRQEWYDYLKANCYTPSTAGILSDGTHFAAQGNYLVAALTARHFRYYEDDNHDPNGMVTVYKPGNGFKIENDSINLNIEGNRVDVITENGNGSESIRPLIDGKHPSQFPGCYNSGRSNTIWPGYTNAFGPSIDMQEETWSLNVNGSGAFTLTGSKTGADGNGTVGTRFESNSGRIVIDHAAFFPSWNDKSTLYNQTRTFTTKLYGKDIHTLPTAQTGVDENRITLAQGIPNGVHKLSLTGAVDKVKEIRVYRPPFKLNLSIDRSSRNVKFTKAQGSTTLTVNSNTYWLVYDKVDWITVDAIGNNTGGGLSDIKSVKISVTENTTGEPRSGFITLTGVGVEPVIITVSQSNEDIEMYDVSVIGGTASKYEAEAGETVTIAADAPAEGFAFGAWTGDIETVADVYGSETTFVMPDNHVALAATYWRIGVEEADDRNILLTPNPAGDIIYARGIESGNVTVFDARGTVVKVITGYGGEAIDISGLLPGFYILRAGDFISSFVKK